MGVWRGRSRPQQDQQRPSGVHPQIGHPRLCQTFSRRFFPLLRGAWHWGFSTCSPDISWVTAWCFCASERRWNKAPFSSLEGLVQSEIPLVTCPSVQQQIPPWGKPDGLRSTHRCYEAQAPALALRREGASRLHPQLLRVLDLGMRQAQRLLSRPLLGLTTGAHGCHAACVQTRRPRWPSAPTARLGAEQQALSSITAGGQGWFLEHLTMYAPLHRRLKTHV